MNIIAIGGGALHLKKTLAIDRHIVSLTGKRRPNALLIPTASGDPPEYLKAFNYIYGDHLGCRTEQLMLLRNKADRKLARDKIRNADLIYVGGGNTFRMMRLWRKLGVDEMIREAGRSGTVLSGLSAGAICWYEWGNSDSRKFSGNPDWTYIRVRGMGLCPGIFCPHLDAENRHISFEQMVLNSRISGVGCDNHAAVWYHKSGVTCISSQKESRVHVYRPQRGKLSVKTYGNGDNLPVEPAKV